MKLSKIQPNLSQKLKRQIAEQRKQQEIEKAWGIWERQANRLYRLECKYGKGGKRTK